MTEGRFEPVAIVGQGCVLPGCFTPSGLWRAVRDNRSLLTAPPKGIWGLHPDDHARQPFTAGGFVLGFEKRFQPDSYSLGDVDPRSLDPMTQWLLQAGRDAWLDAGLPIGATPEETGRTSVLVANLSYPSRSLTDYASDIWMDGASERPAIARFNSGYPAIALARSLGAEGTRFCLDAACASSLYALKLACDELHHQRADQVVCGAVNGVDNLFLHQGFAALNAISPTGRSRPLVAGADGLVPSEGAAAVVLKRLVDVAPSERVHGVIRGIGLSNDGRRKGLLAPDADGQGEAMRRAYKVAGMDPARDIGLLECHATGTPVGDGVELTASDRLFGDGRIKGLPVGSAKGNTGHLITVAGLASVLKATAAFEHDQLPPTRLDGDPLPQFDDTCLAPQAALVPWPKDSPRRAGISTFGFGGNNAHMILEAPGEDAELQMSSGTLHPVRQRDEDQIVICGVGANAGPDRGIRAIVRRLMRARDAGSDDSLNRTEQLFANAKAARIPPRDLARTEAQQVAVLDVAEQALADVAPVAAERAGCIVAMGTAPDASRWMLRERLAERFDFGSDATGLRAARDAVASEGDAADVLGAMPNMPANRLNVAHDWRGLGFTVAAEHASGDAALAVAITALLHGGLDMAVVAGADFAADPVHAGAAAALGGGKGADGAAALVLKRRRQAEADGDRMLACVDHPDITPSGAVSVDLESPIVKMYGDCHASARLLEVAIGAALSSRGLDLAGAGVAPKIARRRASDTPASPAPDLVRGGAHLFWAASDTPQGLLDRVSEARAGGTGRHRIALVHHSRSGLDELRAEAIRQTESGGSRPVDGLYWGHSREPQGELAFVFTGSASAYPQTGRGLFMAFPEIGAMLAARSPHMHIPAPLLALPQLTPFQDLCCGVVASQAQALLLREWFGLAPQAAIGLSLGETNALIAFGAWRDPAALLDEIAKGEMYEHHLGTRFDVLRAAWGESQDIAWENWQVSAPISQVKALVAREPQADVTIIYTDRDCLIGGHPDACRRIAGALPDGSAIHAGHDFVIHSHFLKPYEAAWRQYHTRKTHPVAGVRFYSNGRTGAYQPDTEATADAITQQATNTIDFPRTIEQAYADGVRTFVEIGPRDLLTRSIGRILGDRTHLAVAMDRADRSDSLQVSHSLAALYAAGHDIPMEMLAKRLEDIAANPWTSPPSGPPYLALPAHRPAPARPDAPPRIARKNSPVTENPSTDRSTPPHAHILPKAPAQPGHVPTERVKLDTPHAGRTSQPVAPARKSAVRTARPVHLKPAPSPLPARPPAGPSFGRDALEAAARGPISDLFGPLFREQDGFRRQVRLPAPPLLLVDRVTGIDAEPAKEGRGTIWTETDIGDGHCFTHLDHMRPGPLIEAGQADLSLISYMGADLKNRDARVYRLLGCEFTFQNGPMPRPGDTLSYQIEITGHAMSGDVRLFFFQYDCHIGDRLLLSVRNGQAGFFTDDELSRSGGCLWSAETAPPPTAAPVPFVPRAVSAKRAFGAEDLDALRDGDAYRCFGTGFEACAPHSRPPSLPGGRLQMIDAVTEFDPAGGPWKRGYLEARFQATRSAWFYDGHFHNDPCMPGTLMVEGALQALEIFAMAVGMTVERDGFVFEPMGGRPAKFDCRGQVIPDQNHDIRYEVFIDEIVDGDTPVISAALLASCDGLKVFHCERISLALKRAWPRLIRHEAPTLVGPDQSARGDAVSLLACADGAPSEAFGAMYAPFDHHSRVPRLPQPPFHFMSRIDSVSTPAGQPIAGAEVASVFTLPADAWFFADSGTGALPFAALSEILLQPCGWLASHCGLALEGDAYFRNLDGDLTLHQPVGPGMEHLLIRTRLDEFSSVGAITIVRFTVAATDMAGAPVADLKTSFGFFNKDAFSKQAGVPLRAPFAELLAAPARPPAQGAEGSFHPRNGLEMVDALDVFAPDGGSRGLGMARGIQSVDPYAWYFKAHFFQDPVQPGSLGFGALLELLGRFAVAKGLAGDAPANSVQVPALGQPLQWRCRGQVTPNKSAVSTLLDVTDIQTDGSSGLVAANGILACDGVALYSAKNLTVKWNNSV
ncbi:MAG: beta-ketoacyl synthase N-terminal-like domain-containing protein [Pseudomonadota bacterium]